MLIREVLTNIWFSKGVFAIRARGAKPSLVLGRVEAAFSNTGNMKFFGVKVLVCCIY